MASERWYPGALPHTVARVTARGMEGTNLVLARTALLVDKLAKENLTRTTHPPGTPTPARNGMPPSLVTGQLRRSVIHVDVGTPIEPAWRIGPADTRRREGGTWTNSQIGRQLELVGSRAGNRFPWLIPARDQGIASLPASFREEFLRPL